MPAKKTAPFKGRKGKGKTGLSEQPISPNDYLDAADDFESAMRKWRAGDAEKALRFYQRALQAYEEGLAKFPDDFDLAYNKANLQYNIATDAKMLSHMLATQPVEEIELLEQSLLAHRFALQLDQGNAEILFNTATVLTTISEKLNESSDTERKSMAINFLQEAIELFDSCLTRQEFDLDEFQSMQDEPETEVNDQTAEKDDTPEVAKVVEPITPNVLIETALSAMTAITTLISLVTVETAGQHNISSTLASLSELGSSLLRTKLPAYLELLSAMPEQTSSAPAVEVRVLSISTSKVSTESSEPTQTVLQKARSDISLATISFHSGLAEAEYKNHLTRYQTYYERLAGIFQENTHESNVTFFFAQANAFDDLAAAVLASQNDVNKPDAQATAFRALVVAEEQAAKTMEIFVSRKSIVGESPHLSDVLLLRGDIALRKYRLLNLPGVSGNLGNANMLQDAMRQARGFYEAAETEAAASKEQEQNTLEAKIKKLVVESGGNPTDSIFAGINACAVRSIVQEMADEGLMDRELKH